MVLEEPKAPSEMRPPETPEQTLARIKSTAAMSRASGALDVTFRALGTRCRISFAAQKDHLLADLALQWLASFEAKYSRFLPGSLVSRINANAGVAPVSIDEEAEALFSLCDQIHFMTRSMFDPTALPLLRLWSWKQQRVPSGAEISEALRIVGWHKVQRKPGQIFLPERGMGIDLGGVGKEFAVDSIAQLLAAEGAQSILVDFGADIRVIGQPADGRPAWHVGLDDPRTPGKCWCGLGIFGGGVATSGDYLRCFDANGRRYGHIIDVRTGQPVQNDCRAVSVAAPSCTQAGMIATAAFILGPRDGMALLEMPGVCGAFITDRNVHTSRRFHEHMVS